MKSYTAFIALSFLVSAALGDFTINGPIEGTKWDSGKQAQVTWIPTDKGFDQSKTCKVDLLKGDPKALQLVATLGDKIPEGGGSISVNVPGDLTSCNDYVVRICETYSHSFTVNGKPGSASSCSSGGGSGGSGGSGGNGGSGGGGNGGSGSGGSGGGGSGGGSSGGGGNGGSGSGGNGGSGGGSGGKDGKGPDSKGPGGAPGSGNSDDKNKNSGSNDNNGGNNNTSSNNSSSNATNGAITLQENGVGVGLFSLVTSSMLIVAAY